jgi:hypothetical protein
MRRLTPRQIEEERTARAERAILRSLADRPRTRGELIAYAGVPRQLENALGIKRVLDRLIGLGLVERVPIVTNRIHKLGNYLEPPREGFCLTARGREFSP